MLHFVLCPISQCVVQALSSAHRSDASLTKNLFISSSNLNDSVIHVHLCSQFPWKGVASHTYVERSTQSVVEKEWEKSPKESSQSFITKLDMEIYIYFPYNNNNKQ